MHRFSSKSTIFRFRLAAFLICFTGVTAPAIVGLMVYSFARNDLKLMIFAMGAGIACALLCALQWWAAARTHCPLCMTSILARKGCSKHHHAHKMLGSYRLKVALAILFRDSFQCPYCHEWSAMEVRSRQPTTGVTASSGPNRGRGHSCPLPGARHKREGEAQLFLFPSSGRTKMSAPGAGAPSRSSPLSATPAGSPDQTPLKTAANSRD